MAELWELSARGVMSTCRVTLFVLLLPLTLALSPHAGRGNLDLCFALDLMRVGKVGWRG